MIRGASLACLLLVACSTEETPGSGGGGTGASDGGGATTSTNAGGGGSAQSSAGGGAVGVGGAGGGEQPDPCDAVTPACGTPAPTSAGLGLVALDRCGFMLERSPVFDDYGPLIDDLETIATPVELSDVLGDLNRQPIAVSAGAVPGGPASVTHAFRWEDSEYNSATWVPQGISGSPDASPNALVEGRRLVLVSWYFDEAAAPSAAPKGVRLAMVDVTNPAAPVYRFLLLVEPKAGPTFAPVTIHAGGIAWVGDYLYVADTSHGVRVFDMRRILRVDTSEDVIGCDATVCKAGLYKYALPQVGAYRRAGTCTPAPRFSFVALDKSASPPLLVTGEYCATTACDGPLDGRLFRYPLDGATGLLAGGDRTFASDAFFSGETQIQGGVSKADAFYLSSSQPAAGAGALYRVTGAGRTSHGWVDSPEDVMIDPTTDEIWSLSEASGARYVFSAKLTSYP